MRGKDLSEFKDKVSKTMEKSLDKYTAEIELALGSNKFRIEAIKKSSKLVSQKSNGER